MEETDIKLSEEKKQKLKEYQKNYCKAKKVSKNQHIFSLFVFFFFFFSLYKKLEKNSFSRIKLNKGQIFSQR